jgi:hypothetical protein
LVILRWEGEAFSGQVGGFVQVMDISAGLSGEGFHLPSARGKEASGTRTVPHKGVLVSLSSTSERSEGVEVGGGGERREMEGG